MGKKVVINGGGVAGLSADNRSLRFFQDSARRMATYLDPRKIMHLLDVATGTGNAAITLARHLPMARIMGVDFSLQGDA